MSWVAEFYKGDDDTARIACDMQLIDKCVMERTNFDYQWEEGAALAWPEYRGTFSRLRNITPGQKQAQYQLDSATAIASHRFMAVVSHLLFPDNLVWSIIKPYNPDLLKDKPTKLWFQRTTKKLWDARYHPYANFSGQNQQNCQSLGVFGNMALKIDERQLQLSAETGLSYQACPVGEVYVFTNFQGMVIGYARHFQRDAQEAFGLWGEKIPQIMKVALDQHSRTQYNFYEIVHPRTDYSPHEIFTPRGKRFASRYISVEGHCYLEEGGYRTLPLPYGRYMVAPGEKYGRGPLQQILGAAKSRNAMKKDFMKTAHAAGDPAYLIGDDGMVDLETHSGARNQGGMTRDGKPLIGIVPHGELPPIEAAMKEEGQFIDDAFLTTLFMDILREVKAGAPQRSAREYIERMNDRNIFLSPLGGINSGYTATMVDRELDILSYLGKLDPMTPAMKEDQGDELYKIGFKSLIGRGAEMQEAAAVLHIFEAASSIAQATGDNSVYDELEAGAGLRIVAEAEGAPDALMASDESKAQKQQARQQQQAEENRIKALPAEAANKKADAIMAKAQTGGNIGGTLSGTPQGGMPQIPGQPGGTPGLPSRRPGMPGTPGRPPRR